MLTKPHKDWVEFRRIGSKRQRLTHFAQRKTGLGPYDDKIFQSDAWRSRPLGHWRNHGEVHGANSIVSCQSPPILMSPQRSFDIAQPGADFSASSHEEPEAACVMGETTLLADSEDEEIEDLFFDKNAGE